MNPILKLLNIHPAPGSSANIIFKNIFPMWVIILVIIPLILIYTWTIYKREKIESRKGITTILSLLRILAIILTFLFLWEPVIVIKDFYYMKSKFIFLIDDSKSMSIVDKYDISLGQEIATAANITKRGGTLDVEKVNQMNRLEIVKNILTNFVPSLAEFKEHYDFRFYTFSEVTNIINDTTTFSELKPIGNYTAIGEAIKNVFYEQKGSLLAGIAIISDGVNNAGENPISVLEKISISYPNTHIFTLGVGNPNKPKDIILVNLVAPEEVNLNDNISFEYTVRHVGYEGKTISCGLELDNKSIDGASRTITLPVGKDSIEDKIEYKADKEGDFKFAVNCAPSPEELNFNNNRLEVNVKVRTKLVKLLYIEKWPRFEYRAIKDLVIRDTVHYEAQLYLIEATDGFIQDYTPARNNKPLEDIPVRKSELFTYDVILIGDVEPRDLHSVHSNEDFMTNLVKFVDEYGGGVGFIAGNNMPIAFKDTPLKEILPFTITGEEIMRDTSESEEDIKIDFKLTREGEDSEIFRFAPEDELSQLFGKKEDKNILSGFYSFVPIKRRKPGTEVLANFIDPHQRFGTTELPFIIKWTWGIRVGGRIIFIATDELWRWREYLGSKYHSAFWDRVINYLKGGYKRKGKRFILSTDDKEYSIGEEVKISVKAYDKDFNPLQAEEISLSLLDPENNMIEIKAKKTAIAGSYTYVYIPDKEGKYTLSVKLDAVEGSELEEKIGFEVKSTTPEFLNMVMDEQMLKNIALKMNGNFYYIWNIKELKKQFSMIPEEASQISKITEYDLWNTKILFFIFLIILSCEWIIRKLVQLL